MKKETINSLKRKGWSEEDIRKTDKIIESRKLVDKSRTYSDSNRITYWTVIFVMILGNFIMSFIFIPFLLVFNKTAMDIVVVVLGFTFGALFNLLMLDLEHIEKKHHLIAGILIPVLALVNISVMVKVANAINDALVISSIREGPFTISILYVVAFMLPYLWSVFVKKSIDLSYKQPISGLEESEKIFEKKY